MTDFRALCAEMADWIHDETRTSSGIPHPLVARARAALAQPEPQGPMPEVDDILRLAAIIRRVDGTHDKGAAALAEAILSHPDSRWQHAQPVPQGPTDEELMDMAEFYIEDNGSLGLHNAGEFARAVLAHYGRPAIVPVPVSERLPLHLAGELDDQGTCWNYHPINLHYCLCVPDPSVHTHWLPRWALPVPKREGEQ
jgi:hypothetical protein